MCGVSVCVYLDSVADGLAAGALSSPQYGLLLPREYCQHDAHPQCNIDGVAASWRVCCRLPPSPLAASSIVSAVRVVAHASVLLSVFLGGGRGMRSGGGVGGGALPLSRRTKQIATTLVRLMPGFGSSLRGKPILVLRDAAKLILWPSRRPGPSRGQV